MQVKLVTIIHVIFIGILVELALLGSTILFCMPVHFLVGDAAALLVSHAIYACLHLPTLYVFGCNILHFIQKRVSGWGLRHAVLLMIVGCCIGNALLWVVTNLIV